MKLTKSLIIATLATGTLWAQAPTNQVISNAKSQVNSVGQAPAPPQGQQKAKPSATSAKPAVAKSAVPAKPVAIAPKPVSTPAKPPANNTAPAPSSKPAAPATKATQPSAANTKPATQSANTKAVPASAKPVVPATKPTAPAMVTKAAPVAIKATTNAAPEKKPLTPEAKKPVAETKKPVAETKKPVAKVEAKPATKTNEKAADAAKPASAKETTTSRISSMAGKRDPFVSPIVRASAGGPLCETGKRCLMVDQIELKGIVKAPSGFIAVVENPMKRAYFLRENDPVFNGSVVKITADTVVFRESTTDKLGKQGIREVVKKVNAPVV